MAEPASLLSYYPNYALLDQLLISTKKKKINFFFDIKNNIQPTYMQHAIDDILSNIKRRKGKIDTSIFEAILTFLGFHKKYALKRGIEIEIFIFFEVGNSYYHQNISKKYKISRRLSDLHGLNVNDKNIFTENLNKNLLLAESVFNKIPNINVLKLENFEADFIPYYLITRNIIQNENAINLIYSNDHDMLQCLIDNQTYIFSKVNKNKKIIFQKDAMNHEFKIENCSIPLEYWPLETAVIGDTTDDVDGIKGIAKKRFLDLSNELISIVGNMEDIYSKIKNKQKLFSENIKYENKNIGKIIEEESRIIDNLKLVSFELISREFDNPHTTEILDRKKKILNILQNKQLASYQGIKDALVKINIDFYDDSLETLFQAI